MKRSLLRARCDGRFWLVLAVTFAITIVACAQRPRRLTAANEPFTRTSARNEKQIFPKLNINTAAAEDLEKLPSVGEILAKRIVAYREQYGRFRRVEHLMMVPGFSDHKFRALRELVTAE
jgi:competence ComEA-like helix-hairpin-helix protein